MLVDLPFDVLHHVARHLDIRSYHNLRETCSVLYGHLSNENTARKCLERSIPHSTWARLALSTLGRVGFRQLLGRCYGQRQSIQNASPYSATIIGHGTSFVYAAGVLCYSNNEGVRILDFNSGKATEKVLSGMLFCSELAFKGSGGDSLELEALRSVQVCSYSDKIVACLCNFGVLGHFLFAVNVDEDFEPSVRCPEGSRHDRILLCVRVRSTNKLFVRHDSTHLVYGTQSARGIDDHREWLLEVYQLSMGEAVSKEPLQLRNFDGSEIGSTACFTIFEGHFYAVTTQTSLEHEEVDWTSYYRFIGFPLNEPSPDLTIRVIWRRQHVEGPINDFWTVLEFQNDHRTGELLIIECRKEWINGDSRSSRTFYSRPFHRAENPESTDGLRHPPDDPLSKTLNQENNSRFEPSRHRAAKYVHTEAGASGSVKEYIRAKTKWNGYCFNSQSFVDIVTEEFKADDNPVATERIKLRVVSRSEISPFSPSHISLWPPDSAPQSLHDILCPGGRAGEVKAELGDEGLIYMAGPPIVEGHDERALVFVSFDPLFGFEGMTRLDGTPARQRKEKEDSSPCRAKKRKFFSSDGQGRGIIESTPDKGKRLASSDLPDRPKRIKTDDQGTSETLPIPTDSQSSAPTTSTTALTPTPSACPPPLPTDQAPNPCFSSTSGHDEATTQSSSSSPTSDARSRHPPDGYQSAGLLAWQEKAAYLTIAESIWTR
ncbi:uncharacterized protein A1O9_12922 [Exophiala aquamarina CBS 119918]|uniref:F-box domain-containing protein n=1 Tax=Exophiala aquamarina CBS 119918 TaxID=1182545 RepID=A0A072NVG6_9EURO|nr:uncharacterized protein A1O9_12922 [Exophiala aquamarina CBS 119918]KEF51038.1 hypothetical protein A1O9_12922 [Exophiala aquamarina CBS 119918]